MKHRQLLCRVMMSTVWVLTHALALAQDAGLSLKHGIYVDASVSCKEPPFAVMRSWDGVGFSGPHASRCISKVLSHQGSEYRVSTSCSAIGDGTPNPSGKADVETISLTRLSSTRFVLSSETRSTTTYRWCSVDSGLGNFPKRTP